MRVCLKYFQTKQKKLQSNIKKSKIRIGITTMKQTSNEIYYSSSFLYTYTDLQVEKEKKMIASVSRLSSVIITNSKSFIIYSRFSSYSNIETGFFFYLQRNQFKLIILICVQKNVE